MYESASIDGAGKVQSFFKITLPLLKPTIESVLILGFIYTFKVYDLVYVMTGGGPVNSTHMLSTLPPSPATWRKPPTWTAAAGSPLSCVS